MLHRDTNDVSIDDALTGALEIAEVHVVRYIRQDFRQTAANTATIYDRPEDGLLPLPVAGCTVTQVRFYRTPSATAYIGKPLIDYEIQQSDGIQPPANLVVQANASGGSFAAGTYYWVATALNGAGETQGSNERTATIALNGSATVAMQLYGGEQQIRIYRVTVQGTESTNAACLVGTFPVQSGVPIPGQTGGPLTVAFTDTGAATTAGSAPITNGTTVIPPRKIRCHPTYFDVPFEGAVAAHIPDNWSRVEIDYVPTGVVPPPVRDATALTAATAYLRGPVTSSGLTTERLGDYMWSTRNFRDASGANEVIPEVAKALLRPWKRRGPLTT